MDELQLLNYLHTLLHNLGFDVAAAAVLYEARKRGYNTKRVLNPRRDEPYDVSVCLDGKEFTETIYPDGSIIVNYNS